MLEIPDNYREFFVIHDLLTIDAYGRETIVGLDHSESAELIFLTSAEGPGARLDCATHSRLKTLLVLADAAQKRRRA
ncbi:hypothetical protein [Achromobacter mucicolens]|uniref:hypothetical protein n=1 Tax=Achromobacter mucicolens TaxID=1389922 RepID=UPI0028A61421|nr:hypothetical protein [Achromobacter mucicolens]